MEINTPISTWNSGNSATGVGTDNGAVNAVMNPAPSNVGLPSSPTTTTGPTGVASSSLADQTLNHQAQGTQNLQASVDSHTANKTAAGGQILGYRPDISVVDLLTSKGMPSDFETRATMAAKAGIKDYVGTSDQNKQLIGIINNPPPESTTTSTTVNGNNTTQTTGTTQGAPGTTTGSPGDVYTPQITQVQKDIDKALTDYNSQVTQILNGTFPLTAYQQKILDTTKTQFEAVVAMQVTANKSYENAVALAGNRLGLNIQNPQEFAAQQHQAISNGLEKINNLEAEATNTMAKLQQGFMDKDYQIINDSYNILQKTLDSKSKAITDLQTRMDTIYKDTRDYNMKIDQFAKDQELKKSEFEATQKMEAAKLNQPSYQIHDNPDGSQTMFNSKTGQRIDISSSEVKDIANATPGNTGVPLLDNNTKKTATGIPWIDGTNLSGNKAAQLQAAKYKLPFLGTNQAAGVSKIDNARMNMNDIASTLDSILPKDASGRALGGAASNKISEYFQTDDQKASFNTWRSAAITDLQALAGGAGSGLRINQAEIALSVANDIPQITDTVGVAQGKIAKINAMLNNNEKSMFGSDVYDKFNPDGAIKDLNKFASISPEHGAQVLQIHNAQPNLTPYQVLQLVQP